MKVAVMGGLRGGDAACRLEATAAAFLRAYSPSSSSCLHDDDESSVANSHGNGSSSDSDASSAAMMDAVKDLLQCLGEDVARDGLKRTPLRVTKAFKDATKGYGQVTKDIVGAGMFTESGIEKAAGCGGGNGGLVVVRSIDHFSSCEACLLPFKVRFHIGYISANQRVIGLSKLSRVAESFAKRLQSPQKLADDVSKALHNTIKPLGVAVAMECWHIHCPGVEDNADDHYSPENDMPGWMKFSVCKGTGVFENKESDFWSEFMAILKLGGIHMEEYCSIVSCVQNSGWCPFRTIDDLFLTFSNGSSLLESGSLCNEAWDKQNGAKSQLKSKLLARSSVSYIKMMKAVESIILALGQDPKSEELKLTPFRFVWWLLNFCMVKPSLQFDLQGYKNDNALKKGLRQNESIGSTNTTGVFLCEIRIPFFSQCEHHLLPFFGNAHVGYFSGEGNVHLNRSVITSVVHFFSQKLQVQERLTKQIAETIYSACNAAGVMVVVEADHVCMLSRGIEKIGCDTATTATLGCFVSDGSAKAQFFEKIGCLNGFRR